jgi:hypothetical protein
VDGRNKLSVSEYVAVFLKLHGLLHNSSHLQEAEKYVKTLTTTLTAHVATESLTSWKLVQVGLHSDWTTSCMVRECVFDSDGSGDFSEYQILVRYDTVLLGV